MQNHNAKPMHNIKLEECLKQEYIERSRVKLEEDTNLTYSQESGERDAVSGLSTEEDHASLEATHRKVKKGPNSKHILKNYGKAMCTFASSDMARPFLENIILSQPVKLKEFQNYIKKQRKTIDSMKTIRALLLVTNKDTPRMKAYKEIFQEISIIFIKFFSVNWIFNGKMTFKREHVNARFKMLRRVRNPEQFTYFKDFTKYM